MKFAIFDIETGSRPDTELESVMPAFKAPGNYKDPEKIAAAIEEQKKEWKERAALSAVTGRVLAIGWRQDGQTSILCSDDEAAMLSEFWSFVESSAREGRVVIGFNSNAFDIPFLTRRSWCLGVAVPHGVYGARGYVNSQAFIDLMDEWKCGDRQASVSLDTLAKFLGVGQKNGDGKFFSQMLAEDRAKAVEYLENDILMTLRVAERLLGVKDPAPMPEGKVAAPPKTKPATKPAAEPPPLVLSNGEEDLGY